MVWKAAWAGEWVPFFGFSLIQKSGNRKTKLDNLKHLARGGYMGKQL